MPVREAMKECDIRPEHLLRRYLELSAEDARTYFATAVRERIDCVACGSAASVPQFEKNGFGYAECSDCGTLFQNPRPPLSAFEAFYRDSASAHFWAHEFFPAVAEARREKIFRPRVERLAALCQQQGLSVGTLIDVGAGYGVFLDEWRRRFPSTRALAIEPSAPLANECRRKGLEVIESLAETAQGCTGEGDAVACFEVLEHAHDPLRFVRVLAEFVRPGGCLLVSTLGVDGFDIQTLWERSNSIFPPHHINFLSVAGFERLFSRAGLIDIEVITPGVLDVDIVRNALREHPQVLEGQRFMSRLVRDERLAALFQQFLADNRLSSHVWVMARRPGQGQTRAC
jgi:SAM-dependent methyltransferase